MGWTRNWDNFNAICMMGDNDTGATGYADGSLQLKNIAGTVATDSSILTVSTYCSSAARSLGHPTSVAVSQTSLLGAHLDKLGERVFLLGGSGTADESYDDYAITGFSGQVHVSYAYSTNPVYNAATGKWTYTVTRIMANNSGAAVTVGEIGLFLGIGITTSGTGNYLMYRKKLATPFEVANGANYSISLDFEYQAQAH